MGVSRTTLAILAGLWLVAFLAALPLTKAPVYWDESVHYQTARHGSPVDERFTDIWGNSLNSPASLFWQRPAWYAAFWLPAQGDLETFRVAHAAVAAGLAPVAFVVLRSFGFHRATGAAAGLAVAVLPPMPTWAAYGFMDPMMATALAVAVVQRRRGRWLSSGAWAVVAVWMKEAAFVLVAAYTAIEVMRGWIRGTATLWPVALARREASAVYAMLIAPLPLVYGMVQDVPLPGGVAYHPTAQVVDAVWGSSWLLLPLLLGLLWPRSRPLAVLGLASGAFFIGLQLAGRSTESWYLAPSILFGLVGCAAALECLVAAAWRHGVAARALAVTVAVAAVAVVGAVTTLEAGPRREALFPLSGVGPMGLVDTYHFETAVRDRDHVAALAAFPVDGAEVLLIEPGWPPPYVALADAGHVYLDLAFFRAVMGFDVQALGERIEGNATWTLVYGDVHPMTRAVVEVYADCIEGRFGGITLIQGAPCAGRWAELEAANQRLGGP